LGLLKATERRRENETRRDIAFTVARQYGKGQHWARKLVQYTLTDAVGAQLSGVSRTIRARTARRWLHRMGFEYKNVKKGVFIDGHEREDVVEYRNNIFLKR
jgi:hypothetical protein